MIIYDDFMKMQMDHQMVQYRYCKQCQRSDSDLKTCTISGIGIHLFSVLVQFLVQCDTLHFKLMFLNFTTVKVFSFSIC